MHFSMDFCARIGQGARLTKGARKGTEERLAISSRSARKAGRIRGSTQNGREAMKLKS